MTDGLDALRERARRLNAAREPARADYVLCWLQQALRANDNPVIDAAVAAANQRGLPVVVYQGIGERYPHASRRIHQFMLEASRSLARDVVARGLRFAGYVERAEKPGRGLLYRLAGRAALVFTDDVPAFVARSQAARAAARLEVPLVGVDAACLVPLNRFPRLTESPPNFRRAHEALRERYLRAETRVEPEAAPFGGELGFEPDDTGALDDDALDRLVASCRIDQTLPPAPEFRGGREAALARLGRAVEEVLPVYEKRRSNPSDPRSASKLSPYLHFGVLGPREAAQAVLWSEAPDRAKAKFLDELLTWREFFHQVARHEADPADYANVPHWARATLAKHAGDPRPLLPSPAALLRGETGDETWDAAQRQYLVEGWMHNNLRMYWGKKLIAMCATPQEAWATAVRLNDRLSLDGRDAATYGNLQWCFGRFGGIGAEAPVYGTVKRHGDTALRRRGGAAVWLRAQSRAAVPDVAGE